MQHPFIIPQHLSLDQFIAQSLQEDIGSGDYTTLATIPTEIVGTAQCLIKDTGILAGVEVAERIFKQSPVPMHFSKRIEDGASVQPGDIAFTVEGSVHTLLTYERLVLNIMQRMSGIATITRQVQNKIAHTHCKVLDTRKTTPLNRMIEKWAVSIGGGHNHRFGLFDMILIKDNHIDFAGGVVAALQYVQTFLKKNDLQLDVEIEARTIADVDLILEYQHKHAFNIKRVLLDNMNVAQLQEAVRKIGGQTETEASGGITPETLVPIAETGVNYLSMGMLTHSFKSLDISLKAKLI